MTGTLTLRPYTAADEDAAIELWRRTWALHYPRIDFTARVPWWRERWRQELVPSAEIVLAEQDSRLVGFVTIEPATMYLDQIVVAPEAWGAGAALAARRSQAPLAQGHRSQGQQGQCPRHPLL
jgi:putative acetyltransferase